ncbi:MAG: helix-turn-helix transcriptional regulator [Alphaproteobacteria bacterium]|nr:helix-turn-helix transcriptional regulator [Alphaproteobacteria bacterium]
MQPIYKNEPVRILIDTKHFGNCLRNARKNNKVSLKILASNFGITNNDLLKMENGRVVMHKDFLTKLFSNAISNIIK